MENENLRLQELLNRYLTNQATQEEEVEFWDYVENPLYAASLEQLLSEAYQSEWKGEGLHKRQQSQILDRIFSADEKEYGIWEGKPMVYWQRVLVAAAVLVLLFGAILFLYPNLFQREEALWVQDVSPGKQGATLTLANGHQIRLTEVSNEELARETGITVRKTADGQLEYEISDSFAENNQFNTITTANGERYRVRLPDGSVVWLNAASSITYATNLIQKGKRLVKLEGEAYFEIAKIPGVLEKGKTSQAMPFVVQTGTQEVEVLGTHFNINSYREEKQVTTTLLEGSVRVHSAGLTKVLKPGEHLLNDGVSLELKRANTEEVMDWKNGDFYLDNVDFKVAMRKIARWYDVEIIYDSSVPEGLETGGLISRNRQLSAVLNLIESSGMVHFKVEGKKVYVSR